MTCGTEQFASSGCTRKTRVTLGITLATVGRVGFQIHTNTAAQRLSRRTCTSSVGTRLATGTLGTALSTVRVVHFYI